MSLVFTDSSHWYQMCITCNNHEYAPVIAFTMWVLDAGRLTLNARCITKGMMKSRLTSCLLLTANNCWTRSFCTRILTIIFLKCFWLRWGKKTFVRKRFLKWVCMLPYLPLPLLGTTANFRQSVNILCWTICWIKYGEAHDISPCLVFCF